MDYIFVNGLAIKARIGIYEWEQQIEQTVLIDIEMGINVQSAASADNISESVNYFNVAETIKALFAAKNFNLVESAAETIATKVFQDYPIEWLKLRVGKPHALADAALVGVVIERQRVA